MSGARIGKATPVSERFAEHSNNNPTTISNGGPGATIINVENPLGRNGGMILWVFAVIAAASLVGNFVAFDAYRHLRNHVNVLQYDLADLRAKTGNAHENTE